MIRDIKRSIRNRKLLVDNEETLKDLPEYERLRSKSKDIRDMMQKHSKLDLNDSQKQWFIDAFVKESNLFLAANGTKLTFRKDLSDGKV